MIAAFNQNQFLRLRHRRDQRFQVRLGAKLVASAADEQLRLCARMQEIKRISPRRFRGGGDWNRRNTNSNHCLHPRIRTRRPQTNRRAEGESREHQGQMKLRVQPVKSSANILDFAVAVIVLALAESGAAEVEAQYGKSKTAQRLHGVEHHLVMQSPAEQWMRMANHSRVRRILCACIKKRFQSSRWTFEEERSNG